MFQDLTYYIIVAIFGLIIGSFLNVVILRFDELNTLITTRSHCPKCQTKLAWYDLIPLVSFILLGGKCRYCKTNISVQYPLVEMGTALIFVLLFYRFGFSLEFFFLMVISAILIIVFVYDLVNYLIADILIWLIFGLWLIYLILNSFWLNPQANLLLNSYSLFPYLFGGLIIGSLFAFLVIISKQKWMGAGDIGLGFVLGFITGWPNVLLLLLSAFALGGLVGVLLIMARKKGLKSQLPFAPFLIIGSWIALILGDKLIQWYWGGILN